MGISFFGKCFNVCQTFILHPLFIRVMNVGWRADAHEGRWNWLAGIYGVLITDQLNEDVTNVRRREKKATKGLLIGLHSIPHLMQFKVLRIRSSSLLYLHSLPPTQSLLSIIVANWCIRVSGGRSDSLLPSNILLVIHHWKTVRNVFFFAVHENNVSRRQDKVLLFLLSSDHILALWKWPTQQVARRRR